MNKTFGIAILLALLASLLLSCGGDGADDGGTATGQTTGENVSGESAQNADLTPYLPEADYEGYEFNILIRQQVRARQDFIFEDTAEVLDEALYQRQLAVEERFGITIKLIEKGASGDDAVTSIRAGDDDYDLVLPHAHVAWGSYIIPGLALDWADLPHVDLDRPWWNRDARESLSIGGKIFTTTGDASYLSLGCANAIAFNKKLFKDLEIPEPYQMVLEGKWTFDEFARIVRMGSRDLNGDGVLDIKNDRLGFVTTIWQAPVAFLYTCGARTTRKDANDIPYIALNESPKTITFLGELFELLKSEHCHDFNESEAPELLHIRAFEDEKALMMDLNIYALKELRGMDNNYGILPYPKYTESDAYTASVDAGVHTLIVPHTAKDPGRTSAVLESLSAEGYKTVMPAFYEKSLQVKYTRDDVSVQMLDIIKDTRVFDFGYYSNYNANIGMAGYHLFKQKSYDFVSYYEKNETAAQRALDKYIDSIVNK